MKKEQIEYNAHIKILPAITYLATAIATQNWLFAAHAATLLTPRIFAATHPFVLTQTSPSFIPAHYVLGITILTIQTESKRKLVQISAITTVLAITTHTLL